MFVLLAGTDVATPIVGIDVVGALELMIPAGVVDGTVII